MSAWKGVRAAVGALVFFAVMTAGCLGTSDDGRDRGRSGGPDDLPVLPADLEMADAEVLSYNESSVTWQWTGTLGPAADLHLVDGMPGVENQESTSFTLPASVPLQVEAELTWDDDGITHGGIRITDEDAALLCSDVRQNPHAAAPAAFCAVRPERLAETETWTVAAEGWINVQTDVRFQVLLSMQVVPPLPAPATEPLPPQSPPPASYSYECPPGETEVRDDGLCVGHLSLMDAALTEPFLAIHPRDDDVMAIGAIATKTRDSAPSGTGDGVQGLRTVLFVSSDGGASWSRVDHPPLPVQGPAATIQNSVDPALSFDTNGTLHLTVLGQGDSIVYYMRSPDLGETWSDPLPLSVRAGDRNWLTTGPDSEIYASWYGGGNAFQATSNDSGQTWQRVPWPGCSAASQIQHLPTHSAIACVDLEDGQSIGTRVGMSETDAGPVLDAASLHRPDAWWPFLLQGPDARLHLVTPGADQQAIWYATSDDHGRTWSDYTDLRPAISMLDDWERVRPYWVSIDPWGALHLLLSEDGPSIDDEEYYYLVKPTIGPLALPVAHAVLDPTTHDIISERMLSSPEAPDPSSGTVPWAVAPFDHYFGMAFTDDHGLLLWAEQGSLLYTRVDPGGLNAAP